MHTITARVDNDLSASLSYFAERLHQSKSYILRNALEAYIQMQEDAEDHALAREALKNDDGYRISLEEIEKKYGLAD
jgi:predicted transcriptional regulator